MSYPGISVIRSLLSAGSEQGFIFKNVLTASMCLSVFVRLLSLHLHVFFFLPRVCVFTVFME